MKSEIMMMIVILVDEVKLRGADRLEIAVACPAMRVEILCAPIEANPKTEAGAAAQVVCRIDREVVP